MTNPESMPQWQRTYLVACVGLIGFSVAYMLCDYGGWPKLTFDAYTGEWSAQSGDPGAARVNYPGYMLWGVIGGLVMGGMARAVTARLRGAVSSRWLRLCGAWAATAVGLCALYFFWSLWPV